MQVGNKDYKICNVLGGLDVTRLVSRNARNFFAAAIDDTELMREFLNEAIGHQNRTSDFASLEEMSRTLDWRARDLPNGTNSIEAGLGYTDDRVDRRVERHVGLLRGPLVGDKDSDFAMSDALSPLLPWITDRRSKESSWWKEHQVGQSEGDEKEPFMFDALYVAAWITSYAEVTLYYPPLSVYGHPATFGDMVGPYYDSLVTDYMAPTMPENNPARKPLFTVPYSDDSVPGSAMISAVAPVYFSGSFMGYAYDDTYIGTVGMDISISSISAFLDVLQNSLTPTSFGILVDASFNTIAISQEVVKRIYPERTGMEEERVTFSPADGSIVSDRRNQTYLTSDTIKQDLTKLDNADWGRLLQEIHQLVLGDRKFTTLDITLTSDTSPTEFYVMFERWKYVADWTLLVFAPTAEVQNAINVYTTTRQHHDTSKTTATNSSSPAVDMIKGEQGTLLRGYGTLVNAGSLDVEFSVKTLPDWVKLDTPLYYEQVYHLRAGQELQIHYQVDTSQLTTGTQSSAILFNIQDDEYPDCSFNKDVSIPISVMVTEKACADPSQNADANGVCVCSSGSVEISGSCVDTSTLIVSTVVPVLLLALLAFYINGIRKRRLADSVWIVQPSELKYDDPPKVIGEGSFGRVYLAEYRTTQVAVKCIHPERSSKRKKGSKRNIRSTLTSDYAMEAGTAYASPEQAGTTATNKPEVKSLKSNKVNSGNGWWNGLNSKSEFMNEMRLLSKLRHPCVTTVMGAVISKQTGPMMVMEYMENGSLYDVLHNMLELDGELILSIMNDISSGVRFLHNTKPSLVHGDLKSHNVLVDSKFRAKVSDFGLANQKTKASGTAYWMSPELLQKKTCNTTASDVYAFGIIMYEIYSRKDPYHGEDPTSVIRDIIDPAVDKRPPVPSAMKPCVSVLMQECLVREPEERPTFDEIATRLKRFKADDVEPIGLVKRAPGEKNFDLLLKVFPRHIAEALRDGREVEPEHHDCVTIFFSDVVGFTTISSELDPQKVSNMLHRLFNRFDALAEKHQVFKVETIGDAWMGVTNCVADQSEDHAKRIALFALDAVQAASETLIDEDDPDRGYLAIRVGFHSGPVLTNVIGSHTPHYSLFGDTVNTASRMESNSEPGRIHCSKNSALLLQDQSTPAELGICRRGKIHIKGKGEMTTFWVNSPSIDV